MPGAGRHVAITGLRVTGGRTGIAGMGMVTDMVMGMVMDMVMATATNIDSCKCEL